MMKMYWNYLMARLGSKKGQGMVEYGLIIGIVAVILITALGLLSTPLNTLFGNIRDAIGGTADGVVLPSP